MENVVDAFAGSLYAEHILKVHLLEGDRVADVGEIFEISRREIVNAADCVALFDESMGQGRANETCDSGDEITGHLSSTQACCAGVFIKCDALRYLPHYQDSQGESQREYRRWA